MHSKYVDKEMLIRDLTRLKNIIKPEHFNGYMTLWSSTREKTYDEVISIIEDFKNESEDL